MGKEHVSYRVIIFDQRTWNRDCDRIPKKQLDRIVQRIQMLQSWNASLGLDVRVLQQYDAADFRLRVGDYRVLLNKDDERKEIHLLRVLHRSKLY